MKVGTVLATVAVVVVVGIGSLWHFGLGNSRIGGEAVGQAKKLSPTTPLICPDYTYFDMSMGVLRNGTGSMSRQDMDFTLATNDPALLATLKKAVDGNLIVKVYYDTRRAPVCTESYILTGAEIVQ